MTETPETGGEQSSAERAETGLEPQKHQAEPVVTGKERRGMFGVHGTGDTSGYGGLRLPAYTPAPAERPYGGWFDAFA
ncbi:MAG TPA: NADH-quinone oxidoreductase subunit C, partial [Amycolatopsis sp.]|nr:NADH-quinone oxidoreductase subunit C [Amycolatopsis sp.]